MNVARRWYIRKWCSVAGPHSLNSNLFQRYASLMALTLVDVQWKGSFGMCMIDASINNVLRNLQEVPLEQNSQTFADQEGLWFLDQAIYQRFRLFEMFTWCHRHHQTYLQYIDTLFLPALSKPFPSALPRWFNDDLVSETKKQNLEMIAAYITNKRLVHKVMRPFKMFSVGRFP